MQNQRSVLPSMLALPRSWNKAAPTTPLLCYIIAYAAHKVNIGTAAARSGRFGERGATAVLQQALFRCRALTRRSAAQCCPWQRKTLTPCRQHFDRDSAPQGAVHADFLTGFAREIDLCPQKIEWMKTSSCVLRKIGYYHRRLLSRAETKAATPDPTRARARIIRNARVGTKQKGGNQCLFLTTKL